MDRPSDDTLADRVGRLERENRRLKLAGLLALSLVASVFVMGQTRPSATIEAQEFVIVDKSGKSFGRLGIGDDGLPILILRGKDDTIRALLSVYDDGSASMSLGAVPLGAISRFALGTDEHGTPAIVMRDAYGKIVWRTP